MMKKVVDLCMLGEFNIKKRISKIIKNKQENKNLNKLKN